MKHWYLRLAMAVALTCPAALAARAQEPAPEPAPQPFLPPQPANNAADDEQAAAAAADRQQAEEQEKLAAELAENHRQLQVELRALAERQRAQAAPFAGRADEALARAQAEFQVALAARGATEKAAWLGVATSQVPKALRQHLDLENEYVGLLVERVEPDSPAAEAGLKQFDIVEKLDDQWIINTDQFSALLRMREPGAEVTLSLIRKGQPATVKAKLAEKELPVLGQGQFEFFHPVQGRLQLVPQGRMAIEIPKLELEHLKGLRNFHENAVANIVITDDEHTLKLTTRNGKKTLEVSDPAGVMIFSGPLNTPEDRAKVPTEIAKKLQKFDDMPGLGLPAPPTPPTQPANVE